ncbi:MAG: fluoride efflux transporter CrcB [Phycisphaerales bacterium]|nr:fluoride efflux transporter CrcB [Phycisphaerales bacterium]
MIANVICVAIGGAIGSVARYLLTVGLNPAAGAVGFPLGTLVVNLVGSIAFGVIACLGVELRLIPETIRVGLLAGVLGGFTTFSTFSHESWALAAGGASRLALLYILASVVLCIVGAWAAYHATAAIIRSASTAG